MFQGIIFSNIQGQAGSKVTTEKSTSSIRSSSKGIIKSIFGRIIKGIFKNIFEGILKGITKGFFKGIYEGIIKGIILVSLRVIDGGFCPGNEFLTLRRGLRCIQDFLSDQLLELGIEYRASAIGLQLHSLLPPRIEPNPPPESIVELV